MRDKVVIFEMGPRDGLQNEPEPITTADKTKLVDLLTACGFAKIETASFVSPKWAPQMADASEVLAGIKRGSSQYTALTPNLQGYNRAKEARVDEVAVFASASEGFSRANINCSIDESLARFEPVMTAAKADRVPVRGYVSCVAVCPFDGPTEPQAVLRVSQALLAMGCYEVSLGDTTGKGQPGVIAKMLDVLLAVLPADRLAGHFHDTDGLALANIEVALAKGLRTFDAAIAGLGGCPYAPGAKGNVASEAVTALLEKNGFATGIKPDRLAKAADFARRLRTNTT